MCTCVGVSLRATGRTVLVLLWMCCSWHVGRAGPGPGGRESCSTGMQQSVRQPRCICATLQFFDMWRAKHGLLVNNQPMGHGGECKTVVCSSSDSSDSSSNSRARQQRAGLGRQATIILVIVLVLCLSLSVSSESFCPCPLSFFCLNPICIGPYVARPAPTLPYWTMRHGLGETGASLAPTG